MGRLRVANQREGCLVSIRTCAAVAVDAHGAGERAKFCINSTSLLIGVSVFIRVREGNQPGSQAAKVTGVTVLEADVTREM